MKTLLPTLFFLLLVTQICFAQWYQQNSGTTNLLWSVSFTDANIGTVVGSSGTILRTTDGGQNWISQSSGTTSLLWGVSFTDENNGTAVGMDGTILRTTDGGQNWISQSSGTTNYLLGVSFTDANTGTAVGYTGTIIRTTDGGLNWFSQISGTTDDLFGVSFTDANNGWIAGGSTTLRTTDGGTTWIAQSGITAYDICFTDANNGTVVGDGGTIHRTTNGGQNWSNQTSGISSQIYGVSFTDANNGTVVSRASFEIPDYGFILRTTDAGQNWNVQLSGTQDFLGVFFIDANNGWVVGENGIILHTTNGGVPVELISFTATTNGKQVILNWSTATEINNQGFEIQRSTDGVEFFTVGFVNGHGTTTEQQNYSFADKNLDDGKYSYRLKQIDYDGSYEYSDVVEVDFGAFNSYSLEQNFPNPFNPTTTIKYSIAKANKVSLILFNLLGEEVTTLVNEEKIAGNYKVEFNATNLPSGVYFYQLRAGEYTSVKKMILIK